MTALAIPKRMALNRANACLCAKIGVRFNDDDMGSSVVAYDVPGGTITLKNGEVRNGKVEPYWRTEKKGAILRARGKVRRLF